MKNPLASVADIIKLTPSEQKQVAVALMVLGVLALFMVDRGLPATPAAPVTPAGTAHPASPEWIEMEKIVLPAEGFQSRIRLGDAVLRTIEHEALDPRKFTDLYEGRGGFPAELADVLVKPQDRPIHLTADNAHAYLNLLWPVGLANHLRANDEQKPLGDKWDNYASTGGWSLGKAETGGGYFNRFKIVDLSPEQEELAVRVAKNIYRPCCGNSTFFQDCNHGSALLGLLELGAAQGLSEDELYREALAFNSFWFSDTYVGTALYFKVVKGIEWDSVDPRIVLNKDFSSAPGWYGTVQPELSKRELVPASDGGGSCSV